MRQHFYIGVDGGGSKSKIRVEDDAGHLLGEATSGPANIRLSIEEAWRSIDSAIKKVLQPHGISLENKKYYFHAGLGLAGCELPEAVEAFLKYPHQFTTLKLNTDAHIACLGAHGGKEGAVIVVGTGVIGYQVEAGEGIRVSGWGFPHDDEGGGAWLGLEATRLTLQWLDHRAEKSPLVEEIFKHFNQDMELLVTWANKANSTEFARLAPIVIKHGQQNEALAVLLMKEAAQAIAKIYQALKKMRKQHYSLPCCLLGGIAPFLEPWLSEGLRSALAASQGDASVGAIRMIREQVKRSDQ